MGPPPDPPLAAAPAVPSERAVPAAPSERVLPAPLSGLCLLRSGCLSRLGLHTLLLTAPEVYGMLRAALPRWLVIGGSLVGVG
jgi:hypothetical protein